MNSDYIMLRVKPRVVHLEDNRFEDDDTSSAAGQDIAVLKKSANFCVVSLRNIFHFLSIQQHEELTP